MQTILEILLNGIVQGAAYSLVAFGLAMVYGTARVLNFAHGSFFTVGAYLCWFFSEQLGLGYLAGLFLILPILFILGVGLDQLVVRPLRKYSNWKTITMMATLGVAFAIDNANLIIFGPQQKIMPPLIEGASSILGVTFSNQKLIIFATSIAIVISLGAFLSRTRHGQAIQAVAQSMEGARIVGIFPNTVFSYAIGIAIALTGLAGALLAPINLISPLGGWALFLKAFVIVVFGGLGSTNGALYAAFILGIIESAVIYTIGATWIMPIWLFTLLIVLMVRPQGLFGRWGE